jgi:tetratricopeptide (TPR) repeat protein
VASNKGKEAIPEMQDAVRCEPKTVPYRTSLAYILLEQKRGGEAIKLLQEGIVADNKSRDLHLALGNVYTLQERLEESEDCYRKALDCDRNSVVGRTMLAAVLMKKDRLKDAEQEVRRGLEQEPGNAITHSLHSRILLKQGRVAQALAAARKAVELEPGGARQHFILGEALMAEGAWAASFVAFEDAKRLRAPDDEVVDPLPWDERVTESAWLLKLDTIAAAMPQGKIKVLEGSKTAALGEFCREHQFLPLTAARFYANVFVLEPEIAENLEKGYRYVAACAAARACSGESDESAKLDEREKSRWRGQAFQWLNTDLVARKTQINSKKLDDRPALLKRLHQWLETPDLAALRNPEELEKLPPEERKAWSTFWADVNGLLSDGPDKKQ